VALAAGNVDDGGVAHRCQPQGLLAKSSAALD